MCQPVCRQSRFSLIFFVQQEPEPNLEQGYGSGSFKMIRFRRFRFRSGNTGKHSEHLNHRELLEHSKCVKHRKLVEHYELVYKMVQMEHSELMKHREHVEQGEVVKCREN
jgi:hypothetical protein